MSHIIEFFRFGKQMEPAPPPCTDRETEAHRGESTYARHHILSQIQEQNLEQRALCLGRALLTIPCDSPNSYSFRVIPVSVCSHVLLTLGQRLLGSLINQGWACGYACFIIPTDDSWVSWKTKTESSS